jgi:hypothetical protein
MNFKKTFEKYIEYKSQDFIYDGIESDIRTDEEIIYDEDLLFTFSCLSLDDNSFNVDFLKAKNCTHDESIYLVRLNWLKKLQEVFEAEYQEYIESDVYFIGCRFDVYEKTYPSRLKEFQEKYIDALEIDFIKNDYIDVNIDTFPENEIYEALPVIIPNEIYENKKYSLKKREEFLKSKIVELGFEVMYYDDETYSYYDELTTTETKYSIIEKQELNNVNTETIRKEVSGIDLSDAKGTEKIIMLHKLGVLDFLKEQEPFKYSINALASAISGITGEKQTVIQSYINPIFSKSVGQKNNPLATEKTVNKVTQKLISIGYNPVD